MYEIILADRKVEKALDSLPGPLFDRVKEAILTLGEDPRRKGARKLKGKLKGVWRIRAGDYRILYDIDDHAKVVVILAILHRRRAYR